MEFIDLIFDYEWKDTQANKLVPIHCSQAKEDTLEQPLNYCFIVHIMHCSAESRFFREKKRKKKKPAAGAAALTNCSPRKEEKKKIQKNPAVPMLPPD